MSRLKNARWTIASVVALGLIAAACGSVAESIETTTTVAAVAETAGETSDPTTTTPSSEPADPNRAVAPGDTVSVHYVGTLDDGELFDSSRDRGEPLSFTVASGQMIPGFDGAVQGMKVGEIKTVRLAPAEAYGEKDPEALIEVPLEQVPEGTQPGDTLFSPQGQGVTVVEINDGIVVIDANHALAGEFLTFEIEVVSIDS